MLFWTAIALMIFVLACVIESEALGVLSGMVLGCILLWALFTYFAVVVWAIVILLGLAGVAVPVAVVAKSKGPK